MEKFRAVYQNRYFFYDILLILSSLLAGFWLRFGSKHILDFLDSLSFMLLLVLIGKPIVFSASGMYGEKWIDSSGQKIVLLAGIVSSSLLLLGIILVLQVSHFSISLPRSVLVADGIFCLIAIGGLRFLSPPPLPSLIRSVIRYADELASRGLRIMLALLSLAAANLVIQATSVYGAGLSPDSVVYISAARSFLSGGGLLTYSGQPLTLYPPIYPVALAGMALLLGQDPFAIASWLNALLLSGTLFLSGLLVFKYTRHWTATVLSLLAFVSAPILSVSFMAWSEPLFIFFCVLALFLLEDYRERNDLRSLGLFSLTVALAALTRYAGIFLVAWGLVMIAIFCRQRLKVKAGHFGIFLALATTPLVVWGIRNQILTGMLFGPRTPGFGLAFSAFIFDTNLAFSNWLFAGRDYLPYPYAFILVVAFLIFLTVTFRFFDQRINGLGPVLSFAIGYFAFVLLSSMVWRTDTGNRMLSPMYLPLVILVILLIKYGVAHASVWGKRVAQFFFILSLAWLAYSFVASLDAMAEHRKKGSGYSSRTFTRSPLLDLLREMDVIQDCAIYSNAPDALYFWLGAQAELPPLEKASFIETPTYSLSDLEGLWPPEGRACLVWLNDVPRDYLFSPQELSEIADVELQAAVSDGRVYSVTRR
jgi:hypothetical protein